jgi:hypothetical protein
MLANSRDRAQSGEVANNLPTRMCDGCGQIWASGSFLDPTVEASCEFCGGKLAHRRRLPNGVAVELGPVRESAAERLSLPSRTPVG